MSGIDEKRSFWITVPGILTGLAAVITAVAGVVAATTGPHLDRTLRTSAATATDSGEATRVQWQHNWLAVSKPRGALGTAGGTWTNRDEFLRMLRALDLPQDDALIPVRDQLLTLVLATPEDLANGPHWSLPYTADMRHLEEELQRGIQDRAIAHHIDVTDGRR